MFIYFNVQVGYKDIFSKKSLSHAIYLWVHPFIYLFWNPMLSFVFLFLKRELEIIQIGRRWTYSIQGEAKQTEILQTGKRDHKKTTGQRCVNIKWYVGSEIQSEDFVLLFLTHALMGIQRTSKMQICGIKVPG